MSDTDDVLKRVAEERQRQRDQWGDSHDDTHSIGEWVVLLTKWIGRIAGHLIDPPGGYGQAFYQQMESLFVKVAAVSVAAAEVCRRQLSGDNAGD